MDTIKGFFIYYSSYKTNIDYHESYSIILPLELNSRELATDSFNSIISNSSNCLNFLNNNRKVFLSLDFVDINYLIKKYNLNSKIEEKIYSQKLFLNSEKEKYQIMRYENKYGNINVSMVLFNAEIVVVNMDKNFLEKNCCDFTIKDKIICYPENLNNNYCKGLVITDMRIIE